MSMFKKSNSNIERNAECIRILYKSVGLMQEAQAKHIMGMPTMGGQFPAILYANTRVL